MHEPNGNGKNGIMTEVNLTPLIDVCLVLVVILLVATPLTLESSIAVRSAAAAGKKVVNPTPDKVEVQIIDDATVSLNGLSITRGSLGSRLAPLLQGSTTKKVVIRCDPGITHGTFVYVLDQAKLSGAADIAVVGK